MTANSWQTTAANAFKTINQVNGMDNVANVFKIADVVMVEDNEGQTREPDFMYAGRDIFEELQLCQRYYEVGYNFYSNTAAGIQPLTQTVQFLAEKRAAVSAMVIQGGSPGSGGDLRVGFIYGEAGGYYAASISSVTAKGFRPFATIGVNDHMHLTWRADAEL